MAKGKKKAFPPSHTHTDSLIGKMRKADVSEHTHTHTHMNIMFLLWETIGERNHARVSVAGLKRSHVLLLLSLVAYLVYLQ